MIIKMIKDLEDTRDKYNGYAYVRTMRNILVGKKDAAIAPYFKNSKRSNFSRKSSCTNLNTRCIEIKIPRS